MHLTPQNPKLYPRLRIERIAFIAAATLLVPAVYRIVTGELPVPLFFIVPVVMGSLYSTAQSLLGIGGFTEHVSRDMAIPEFDWRRFFMEPLYFAGQLVVVTLAIAAAKIWWANAR